MRFLTIAIAAVAVSLLLAGTGCSNPEKTPAEKGLLDPSMVHNPHTINGIDPKEAAALPVMTFADTTHNFGGATEGESLVYDFAFTNTGKTPLLISGASGSCGCTVTDFPREPIAPGKGGVLKAIFNTAGKQGHQEKVITVINNTERSSQLLFIQADITPTKQ